MQEAWLSNSEMFSQVLSTKVYLLEIYLLHNEMVGRCMVDSNSNKVHHHDYYWLVKKKTSALVEAIAYRPLVGKCHMH